MNPEGDGWTAIEIAEFFTLTGTPVKPATIRKWASRGHIDRIGWDDRGRALYDPRQVIRRLLDKRSSELSQ